MSAEKTVIEPFITGGEAEDFIEFFSKKTFLSPWVYRSPKRVDDNKEFTDLAIIFRETIILIEVKGNKFDPRNPQRYLNEAKKRHQQLKHAKNIVQERSKIVFFKNDYFSFKTDFRDIKKIYTISVSTGPGELEIASGATHIDYSKLDYPEVGKYLGFYNPETEIHSFTASELIFASQHIDTLKDFFWYLDFEKKFLGCAFEKKKDKQQIITVVDTHREDMIAIYILNYYWDNELNQKGTININKILGSNSDIDKADMILYAGTDTRKYLEEDEQYKKIKVEKEKSYLWDNLLEFISSNYSFAHSINSKTQNLNADFEEMKGIFEEMSATSRFERAEFSMRILEADVNGKNFRNMFSTADGNETLFTYSKINYEVFPTKDLQQDRAYKHMYSAWCRVKFGESYRDFRDKISKVVSITKHAFKDKVAFTFSLSEGINVDKNICESIGVI